MLSNPVDTLLVAINAQGVFHLGENEYKISKFMLLQFVCYGSILLAADNNMHIILSMLHFLQGHVFVHEDLYLHFRRRTIRHFDCSHGSPHEVHVNPYVPCN